MALHFITRVRNDALTRTVGRCIVLGVAAIVAAMWYLLQK